MKKISIIIPCYNVEKYIDRCFESLCNQTIGMDQMELIFIDDASTDGTYEKLISYEEKYPEDIIVVRFPENQRQGTARNVALEYASAPYIGYVDSDDWVELSMFEKMVEAIETHDCDFVGCRWDFAKSKELRQLSKQYGRNGYFDLSTYEARFEFIKTKIALVTLWDKVYKKSFLVDNDIYCPEHLRHEDFFFSYLVFLYAKNCYFLEDCLYHYFVNPNGTVLTKGAEYHFDQLEVMKQFLEVCKQRGLKEQFPKEVEWMFLEHYYVYMLWEIFEEFPERSYACYTLMKEEILKEFPEYKNNPYRKWEGNAFDDMMLKLLDYEMDEKQFEYIKGHMLSTIQVKDTQDF